MGLADIPPPSHPRSPLEAALALVLAGEKLRGDVVGGRVKVVARPSQRRRGQALPGAAVVSRARERYGVEVRLR